MLGARACSPHTAIHHLGARASSPPPAICHLGAQASSPHAGSAGFQPASAICPAWVRGRPARMLGARASRPHTAIHPITPAPSGCAGVQPACRERGLPACLSDMPRLGAQASSPHAGSAGFQPAYDAPPESAGFQPASSNMPRGCAGFQPACRGARAFSSHAGGAGFQLACRERGRLARIQRYTPSPLHRLGARASRPHAAIHSITPAPPGCAGFQPACRVYRHCARIQQYTPSPLHRLGARASSPHAGCAGVVPACRVRRRRACTQRCNPSEGGTPSSRSACVPPGVNSYTTCPIVSLPGSCYTAIRSWAEACPLLSERP